jgi:putative ABC transport system permease protein
LINRLVFENLKHRPVRTLLSAVAIGVQVTMILTLVGVSQGKLADMAMRTRGTGADISVRKPGSSVVTFNGNMPEAIVGIVRKEPHVVLATGTLVQNIGNFETITGIRLDEFNAMSGGFVYKEGKPLTSIGPGEIVVDELYADSKNVHFGDTLKIGVTWHVVAVVESGKLSRMFAQLEYMQEQYSANGSISVVYAKVDDPKNIPVVIESLRKRLENYQILSMEELTSLFTVNSIPILARFTDIVIVLAVVVGFLVVFLSMYTAVLERTREIGMLKALGASPGYILGILLRETTLLSFVGVIAGILMSYGTRWLLHVLAPDFPMLIVHLWWPYAAAIALVGSLIGAIYPGLKAARQDAIEALAYD